MEHALNIFLNFLASEQGVATLALFIGWLLPTPLKILSDLAKKTPTEEDDALLAKVDKKEAALKAAKKISELAKKKK
jgi:hypothetical protein